MIMRAGFRFWGNFLLISLAILFFVSNSFAFTGIGGDYNINFGLTGTAASQDVNSSSFVGDIVLDDTRTGTWSGGDFLLKAGVYFDQNLPVVTINVPISGSSTTETSLTASWSVSASGNPVNKFWFRLNSNSWIDKGLATTHSLSGLDPGTHTIYVVATDSMDLNSATASVSFAITSPTVPGGGNSTPPADDTGGGDAGVPGGPRGGSGGTAPDVPVDEATDPSRLVRETKYPEVKVENELGVEVSRNASLKIIQTTENGNAGIWAFDVGVVNNSGKTLKEVKVREVIPKEVAKHISELKFREQPTRIINPDPEVEWLIEELAPGESKSFFYYVTRLNDSSIARDFGKFVASLPVSVIEGEELVQEPVCNAVKCNDDNICTTDVCTGGTCYHYPRDGIRCGDGFMCSVGTCIEDASAKITPPANQPKGIDFGNIGIAAVIIICLIVVVGARILGKGKKSGL